MIGWWGKSLTVNCNHNQNVSWFLFSHITAHLAPLYGAGACWRSGWHQGLCSSTEGKCQLQQGCVPLQVPGKAAQIKVAIQAAELHKTPLISITSFCTAAQYICNASKATDSAYQDAVIATIWPIAAMVCQIPAVAAYAVLSIGYITQLATMLVPYPQSPVVAQLQSLLVRRAVLLGNMLLLKSFQPHPMAVYHQYQ